jgi:membrane protein implicated in regulation of membrane protease activity
MPWLPWALYALAVLCFAVVFRTHSLGLALVCLAVALVASVWATLRLVQSRLESRSQNMASMLGPEELAQIRARAEAKRAEAQRAAEATEPEHDAGSAQPH